MNNPEAIRWSARQLPVQRQAAPRKLSEMSGCRMLLCQLALGAAILAAWQVASGWLIDAFFISNPADVARRLRHLDGGRLDIPAPLGDAIRNACRFRHRRRERLRRSASGSASPSS